MGSSSWSERAERSLAAGASTGSKRASALYGADASPGPTHFTGAKGCRVTTAEGRELIDCTMALGSVALGYADPGVTDAVVRAATNGSVSGLSHTLEVEVAERLCEVIPCAERVHFLKTGADAVAAAVRLARVHTGRDMVLGSGYFGWLDWCSNAAGVPVQVTGNFRQLPFNDLSMLESAAAESRGRIAAIVIEPVVDGSFASREWVTRARELCDEQDAVLIFDEVKTGFRLATGGYQQHAGIRPDIAAFAKAMANGFPLSVVCGKGDLMDGIRKTWISSTLASEATALAAASAVLGRHRSADVCGELRRIGGEIRGVVQDALSASGFAGAHIHGLDPMWFLRFDSSDAENDFVRMSVDAGVLFKRGAYNFASLAHDADAIRTIGDVARASFTTLRDRGRSAV